MRFDIITLFPEMFDALKSGVTARAFEQQKIILHCWNLRDFSENKYKRVDDKSYGGGPGMVMQYEPLHRAILAAKNADPAPTRVVYLSPQGKPFTQNTARTLAETPARFIFICGRYEGIDERIIQKHVDEEWSVGDYVLSGGELPAMIIIDAVARLLPGVLNDPHSALQDSFENDLLDCPQYTRPETIDGLSVPTVLQSGDHQAIARWRLQQALGKTWQKRPDLLKRRILNADEKALLEMYINEGLSDE